MHATFQRLIRGAGWPGAALQSALHLLLPRLCAGCRQPLIAGESLLCLGCDMELPRTGFHRLAANDAAARFAGRLPVVHATALLYFGEDSLTQHLIHLLKYRKRPEVGRALGALLGADLRAAAWTPAPDVVAPVPLHPKKEHARGYNQSALIAEGLADALGIPYSPQLLRRTRPTESQTHKTRAERVANVVGAFALRKPARAAGKHVLVVDDVLTTGATLEACAQAVLAAPGAQVSIATLAIA